MSTDTGDQTEAVLNHHLESVEIKNLDAIMQDYDEDSILVTPDSPSRDGDPIDVYLLDVCSGSIGSEPEIPSTWFGLSAKCDWGPTLRGHDWSVPRRYPNSLDQLLCHSFRGGPRLG